MGKIALVRRKHSSSWVSCQSITQNLVAVYKIGFPDAEIREFFFDPVDTRFEIVEEARRLADFAPERVAFIDHMPHPGIFLRALRLAMPAASLPEFIFHVFGDFTLHVNAWLAMADFLGKSRVRFICASEKQTALLRGLIENADSLVHWVPFPVDAATWAYSPALVRSSRARLGIREEDFVFLYSGRLSLQKNVQGLVSSFARFVKLVDAGSWLLLAGRPDDLGAPYLGKKPTPGWLSERLAEQIRDEIPAHYRTRIRYLGDLNPPALRAAYHTADCNVNLSTHNDEDFGMAPAEAACCGLPSLLTDWAGFSSFRHISSADFRYVPVRFDQNSLRPDYAQVLRAMIAVSAARPAPEKRAEIAKHAVAFCATASVAARLASTLALPATTSFHAFSAKFQAMGRAFRARPNSPFLSGTGYSTLYREVYEPYF